MQPLAARKPLPMQPRVDLRCENAADAIALLPAAAKTVGVFAAAVEARPMAGREGGRLIQEEQFCPASSAHHLAAARSEEHTSELQSRENLVCRLLLEKKKKTKKTKRTDAKKTTQTK